MKVRRGHAFCVNISAYSVPLAYGLGPLPDTQLFVLRGQRLYRGDSATMREVEISLTGWALADAMGELRKWLDHHNCVAVNFDIERGKSRVLVVRILFADDSAADVFERDFGGR